MTARLPTVIFVDDDARLLAQYALLAQGSDRLRLAGTASCAAEALLACANSCPDVVVVDVRMPGTDGLSLTRTLLREQRRPQCPKILVLTAFACDEYLLEALGAGARGFLPKSCSWPEVEDGVQALAAGRVALPPALSARLIELVLPGKVDLSSLSSRELEVLRLLGSGASVRDVAARLYIAEATARTHVERLRRKLGVSSRTQLALAARAAGLWVLQDDDS